MCRPGPGEVSPDLCRGACVRRFAGEIQTSIEGSRYRDIGRGDLWRIRQYIRSTTIHVHIRIWSEASKPLAMI